MGARTLNAHLAALTAFASWCVESRRLAANSFSRLRKRDERADRRRERRAMTEDELRRLLTVARLRPIAEYGRAVVKLDGSAERANKRSRRTWKRAPLTLKTLPEAARIARENLAKKRPAFAAKLERQARQRAMIYKLAVLTGMRKGELASLKVGQLELEGRVAFVVLDAADDKAGRGAEIPLRPDLADDLRRWLAEKLEALRATAKAEGRPVPMRLPATEPLVHVSADLLRSFDADLRVAGIPKRDDRGRVLDLHALRHTFGTHLSKGGVAPRIAQAAMRHSTLELTMNTYTDPRLLDVAGALSALPDLPLDDGSKPDRMKATGTDAGSSLVPMLVPDSGHSCTRTATAGATADSAGSGNASVSDAQGTTWERESRSDSKAGDATRTRNVQLGRLMLYH